MYDCDATVLLSVYIYLVFVGEGWLTLVPSCLPHLREWCLDYSPVCRNEYIGELAAAVPELKFFDLYYN